VPIYPLEINLVRYSSGKADFNVKVLTIIGARPEIIQTAPVSAALRERGIEEVLVHTGQHYDFRMSDVFFADLNVPQPDYNLEVGSGTHGEQTGQILMRVEAVMRDEQPDWVLVFGDTNSTVAGALSAAKLHIPLAHIEAGLRSYDRRMPEEVNRVITDHISNVLFAPTQTAVENLQREGITEGVYHIGDVRVDLLNTLVERTRSWRDQLLNTLGLSVGDSFALATIHRASNTDDPIRLEAIVRMFNALPLEVVLPIHPRLTKMLKEYQLTFSNHVRVIEPVDYSTMVALLDTSELVITDSGGLQKEAYMLYRPMITLRDTTEWTETVESGWNRLVQPAELLNAVQETRSTTPESHPDYYGSVGVCQRLCDVLLQERAVTA
jgi:UDP-GlcNAc3NAcA epimerase